MEENRKELTNQELANASGGEVSPECPLGRSFAGRACLTANCQYCKNNYCDLYNQEVSGKRPTPQVIV